MKPRRFPLGVVLVTGAVLGIPLACLAGVVVLGRSVNDAQGGIGRLEDAAVRRERLAALERAFAAMSPAAHLEGARESLADGYDPREQVGGCLDGATRHLRAIPATAPEAREIRGLQTEMDDRLTREARFLSRVIQRAAARTPSLAAIPAAERSCVRQRLAQELVDDFVAHGFHLSAFQAEGPDATVLRFRYVLCSARLAALVAGAPENATSLATLGFRRFECVRDGETFPLELAAAR